MSQQITTDWHQIFLVAAGFLTAILLMWSQHWVRSLYEEQPYDNRSEVDRRFSTHIMRLWLVVGVFFALVAFGLTGLDWLLTRQLVLPDPLISQMPLTERFAAGFLMGAFNITLVGIAIEIWNAGLLLKRKGETKRINYKDGDKRFIFMSICIALSLILACCLFLALKSLPLIPWILRAFLSIIYPILILIVAHYRTS
jgi:hypothetical protein